MTEPTIITIKATKLFTYYYKEKGAEKKPLYLDTRNKYKFGQVIKQTDTMDECPLLYQLVNSDTFKESKTDTENTRNWLHDKLFIMDFDGVFVRNLSANDSVNAKRCYNLARAKDIVENGIDVQFSKEKKVHFVTFDKSGNMSRQSRITFINEDYYDELNRRLNLDMDFSKINVILSKFYAYRGLYLSSSSRVNHKKIEITPETLVIIKDVRKKKLSKDKESIVLGPSYERKVPIVSAEKGAFNKESNTQIWNFTSVVKDELLYSETPFDGVGLISPEYSKYINESLNIDGASSYQVRMPFVKGMLHCVDFKGFLSEHDTENMQQDSYEYEDAFGINRDLKKAQILLTESMFKGMKWLIDYCHSNDVDDPMEYYCRKFSEYEHALYISGTNLPYGHSEYTHLNYQFLNTLNLSDDQFSSIINRHINFIQNPKTYICKWNPSESADYDSKKISYNKPSWKETLKTDPVFEKDKFIKQQISYTKKGLITKIAKGKITVPGQTRFLCRDLLPVLACLIKDEKEAQKFYKRVLYHRFYMPAANLKYSNYYAFFRSPHLSRNEECMLKPFVKLADDEELDSRDAHVKYDEYLERYDKYFGHLTGVVMVPRGSIIPLCLGGADFDGDLVSVVFDEDIVSAVRNACYESGFDVPPKRTIPVVRIPDTKKDQVAEPVPEYVPFEHLEYTFSNSIGLLSNLAIKIGQNEYGRHKNHKVESGSCWKCTVLTGLEIDAAKNGIHPDLQSMGDSICTYEKAEYLKFLDKFDKIRSRYNYDFDKLQVSITDDKRFEFKVGDYTTDCAICEQTYGTRINELPYYFEKEFNHYKNESDESENEKIRFVYDCKITKEEKEKYIKNINDVCALYFKYRSLIRSIDYEKNKSSFGGIHLSKLVSKKYDEEKTIRINEDVITGLVDKIEQALPDDIERVKNNVNDLKWQFQPKEKRADALEKIIGKDFDVNILSDDEKTFLFSFDQYGYKSLWYILDICDKRRIKSYNEIRDDKKIEEINNPMLTELIEELEEVATALYYFQIIDAEHEIYSLCKDKLKNIVKMANIKTEAKIAIMYEAIGSDVTLARFFWDVFEFDEIKKCKVKGESDYA